MKEKEEKLLFFYSDNLLGQFIVNVFYVCVFDREKNKTLHNFGLYYFKIDRYWLTKCDQLYQLIVN